MSDQSVEISGELTAKSSKSSAQFCALCAFCGQTSVARLGLLAPSLLSVQIPSSVSWWEGFYIPTGLMPRSQSGCKTPPTECGCVFSHKKRKEHKSIRPRHRREFSRRDVCVIPGEGARSTAVEVSGCARFFWGLAERRGRTASLRPCRGGVAGSRLLGAIHIRVGVCGGFGAGRAPQPILNGPLPTTNNHAVRARKHLHEEVRPVACPTPCWVPIV